MCCFTFVGMCFQGQIPEMRLLGQANTHFVRYCQIPLQGNCNHFVFLPATTQENVFFFPNSLFPWVRLDFWTSVSLVGDRWYRCSCNLYFPSEWRWVCFHIYGLFVYLFLLTRFMSFAHFSIFYSPWFLRALYIWGRFPYLLIPVFCICSAL